MVRGWGGQRAVGCTGRRGRAWGYLVDGAHDVHSVAQVALDLVEHVLGGAAQQDGTRLGRLAVDHPREVLVADLLDLEEAAARADVLLGELRGTVDDGGAARARDAVVVRLAHAAEHGDVGLEQVVLRQVGDALLGDDQVGLELDDLVANGLGEKEGAR